MTTTVTVRCENENCWKWFEPEPVDPQATPADDSSPRLYAAITREAICPHCGTRQPVPVLEY